MRFPHNIKIFRGQPDMAAFAGVFFLLIIFILLNSEMVFTPGVQIQLPGGMDLPGTENPTAVVSIDAAGQLYFENQVTDEPTLKMKLVAAVAAARGPLTLVVQGDVAMRYDVAVKLATLAGIVGVKQVLLATRPAVAPPASIE